MKKYLNWDFISVVLFVVLVMVASFGLVHTSYTWEEYIDLKWLTYAERIVGYAGLVAWPYIFASILKELVGSEEGE